TRLSGEFLYRLAAEYQDGGAEWIAERMGWGGIFGFLWCNPNVAAVAPDNLPLTRLFRDIDWAVTRSRWSDPAATLFAIKGGQLDWDHQHHDHNHFVLYAHGRPLVTDLNYPHELWGCKTEAHNTIMVNGKEQRGTVAVAGCRGEADVRGELGDLVEAPWYTRVVGDASLSYDPADVKSFVREAIFLRQTGAEAPPDYVILFDDLLPTAPARLDWHLHTYGEMRVEKNRVTIVQDDAALDVTVLAPATFEHQVLSKSFEEAGVSKPFATAKADTFLKLRPAGAVARGVFLTVLAPRKAAETPVVKPTSVEGDNLAGARMVWGAGEDIALFALDEPRLEAAGVKATGRTCVVRRGAGGVRAAVLHQGTRLEADGQTLYESDGSGHAVIDFGEKETTAVLDLYDARRAAFYARRAPTGAWLNGRPVEVRYAPETHLAELDIRGGRHRVRLAFE
ncbi:MAG: heparinase II/III family protein, partial [Armatimonadota bacterium]|nr:heparinase II/III family protein [Armatimonadota bacterium]